MDISGWLNQTVAVAPMTGVNVYGEPTYGQARTLKCRCEARLQKVVGPDGQEVISDHQLVTLEEIDLQDQVWLPGTNPSDPTAARAPLRVQPAVDKAGTVRFWEAYF